MANGSISVVLPVQRAAAMDTMNRSSCATSRWCGHRGPALHPRREVAARRTSTSDRYLERENPAVCGAFVSGRYWARTSDLRLVEAALSQLS